MLVYLIYDDDGLIHDLYDDMGDMLYYLIEYYKEKKYYHYKKEYW